MLTDNDRDRLMIPQPTKIDNSSRYYLQWVNIGAKSNVSGFSKCGDLFGFIGSIEKNDILKTLNMNECRDNDPNVSFNGNNYRNSLPDSTYISLSDSEFLYPDLTVIETLRFNEIMRSMRENIVVNVVACMQWEPTFMHEWVYNLDRLSKWKLQFACECVANRNIMFLEDPTVGLEEDDALHLLGLLKNFSSEGRIIMLTLDNTTQRHLDILSRVQVISHHGAIYFGKPNLFFNFISKLGYNSSSGSSYSYFLDLFFERTQSTSSASDMVNYEKLENGNRFTTDDLEIARTNDNVFVKPERSNVIWRADPNLFDNGAENSGNGPVFIISFFICLWRAGLIRFRDYDQWLNIWVQGGVVTGFGLLFTFYGQELDVNGFQDRCAFLSVAPFGVILLSNLWYHSDYQDRLIYIYERRKRYNHTIVFPIVNIIADVCIVRLFPVFIACIIVYNGVHLNPKWSSKVNFVYTMVLMMIAGSILSRLTTCLNLNLSAKNCLAKCCMTFGSVMAIMVLYAGFLLNLSTLPDSKTFVRNWSIFYWVSDVAI